MKTTNAMLVTAIVGLMALSAVAEDKLPPVAKPVSNPVYKLPEPEPEPTAAEYQRFADARVFHPHTVTCNNPACTNPACTKAAAPACAMPAREPSCEAQVRRLPPAGDPTCAAVGDPSCAAAQWDPTCAAEPTYERHGITTRTYFAPSIFTYASDDGPQWNFPVYRIVKRETIDRPQLWISQLHVYYKDRQLAYKSWSLEREEFEAERAARRFANSAAELGGDANANTMRTYVRTEAAFSRKQNNVAIKQAELACELQEQLQRRAQLQMKREALNYRD